MIAHTDSIEMLVADLTRRGATRTLDILRQACLGMSQTQTAAALGLTRQCVGAAWKRMSVGHTPNGADDMTPSEQRQRDAVVAALSKRCPEASQTPASLARDLGVGRGVMGRYLSGSTASPTCAARIGAPACPCGLIHCEGLRVYSPAHHSGAKP